MAFMLGFTGLRGVGKTTAANLLVNRGFRKAHAFGPGKAMCITYYEYLGIDSDTAWRMVHGDLKDVPHPALPGGVRSRDFMEPFGKFMGVSMGSDWTLGPELDHLKRKHPDDNIVIESLVYEADVFTRHGGLIVRLTREGTRPTGEMTDEAQSKVKADVEISNNGTLENLAEKIDVLLAAVNAPDEPWFAPAGLKRGLLNL